MSLQSKEYYKLHKEEINVSSKHWREKHSEYQKEYYKTHKKEITALKKTEKYKEKAREWQQAHREERKPYTKKYYEEHKEENRTRSKKYRRKYYLQNKEKLKTQRKEYCRLNIRKISQKTKEYKKEHKEEINKQTRKYRKDKIKKDLSFKIRENVRARVRMALKMKYKSTGTITLIGCNIDFLKQHLETLFKPGMSWDNWGTGWNGKGMQEWHIGHIKPCASFDLSKPEEQLKCFHYTNLQPLWAEDNLKKIK